MKSLSTLSLIIYSTIICSCFFEPNKSDQYLCEGQSKGGQNCTVEEYDQYDSLVYLNAEHRKNLGQFLIGGAPLDLLVDLQDTLHGTSCVKFAYIAIEGFPMFKFFESLDHLDKSKSFPVDSIIETYHDANCPANTNFGLPSGNIRYLKTLNFRDDASGTNGKKLSFEFDFKWDNKTVKGFYSRIKKTVHESNNSDYEWMKPE